MGIIRFLLAASVICAHFGGIYGNNLIGGALAVQSFFLLSGFYIVLILEENFSVKSFQEYKSFLSSRLFRLYPAYWLSLAIKFIWGVGFSSTFYSLNLFSKLSRSISIDKNLNSCPLSLIASPLEASKIRSVDVDVLSAAQLF